MPAPEAPVHPCKSKSESLVVCLHAKAGCNIESSYKLRFKLWMTFMFPLKFRPQTWERNLTMIAVMTMSIQLPMTTLQGLAFAFTAFRRELRCISIKNSNFESRVC